MRNYRAIASVAIAIIAIGILAFFLTQAPPQPSVQIDKLISITGVTGLSASSQWVIPNQIQTGSSISIPMNLSSPRQVLLQNISVATPGFTLLSLDPQPPFLVSSGTLITVTLMVPNQSYQGDLILNMTSSVVPWENLSVNSVVYNTTQRAVTAFYVVNGGNVPINITELYLESSDGLIVNQTFVSFPLQQPGFAAQLYNSTISYEQATKVQLFRLVVVTADGLNATSGLFPLNCNCND